MSIPAAKTLPSLADTVQQLQERAGGRGAPVMVGTRWRLNAGRWPDDSGPECLLIQVFRDSKWVSMAVLKPDGTWGYAP